MANTVRPSSPAAGAARAPASFTEVGRDSSADTQPHHARGHSQDARAQAPEAIQVIGRAPDRPKEIGNRPRTSGNLPKSQADNTPATSNVAATGAFVHQAQSLSSATVALAAHADLASMPHDVTRRRAYFINNPAHSFDVAARKPTGDKRTGNNFVIVDAKAGKDLPIIGIEKDDALVLVTVLEGGVATRGQIAYRAQIIADLQANHTYIPQTMQPLRKTMWRAVDNATGEVRYFDHGTLQLGMTFPFGLRMMTATQQRQIVTHGVDERGNRWVLGFMPKDEESMLNVDGLNRYLIEVGHGAVSQRNLDLARADAAVRMTRLPYAQGHHIDGANEMIREGYLGPLYVRNDALDFSVAPGVRPSQALLSIFDQRQITQPNGLAMYPETYYFDCELGRRLIDQMAELIALEQATGGNGMAHYDAMVASRARQGANFDRIQVTDRPKQEHMSWSDRSVDPSRAPEQIGEAGYFANVSPFRIKHHSRNEGGEHVICVGHNLAGEALYAGHNLAKRIMTRDELALYLLQEDNKAASLTDQNAQVSIGKYRDRLIGFLDCVSAEDEKATALVSLIVRNPYILVECWEKGSGSAGNTSLDWMLGKLNEVHELKIGRTPILRDGVSGDKLHMESVWDDDIP